jgi:hypothetical protein
LTVAASIMSVAGHTTTSSNSISKLDAAFIGAAAGILAVALIVALVLFVRRNRFQAWRQVGKVLAPPATSKIDPEGRRAAARAAYERGDYRRVCALLTDKSGALHEAGSFHDQLLLAGACDQLGGEQSSVEAFLAAEKLLPGDAEEKKQKIASLVPSERLIFEDLAQRFPNHATRGPVARAQTSSLANYRQRVIWQGREADKRRGRNNTINVALGALAAAAAAGAGISGVAGHAKVLIGLLALVSAATSTILITLKPAETAEVAKKTAEALVDLSSEIELFETERHTSEEVHQAVIEVQNRLSAAKNRPPLVPLIPPSAPSNERRGQGEAGENTPTTSQPPTETKAAKESVGTPGPPA